LDVMNDEQFRLLGQRLPDRHDWQSGAAHKSAVR
jgi:hypothetical protein